MVSDQRDLVRPGENVSYLIILTLIIVQHVPADQLRICVCVKKRPIFQKELENSQVDCVSNTNPYIIVHECKHKVDGITKYIDNQDFQFDNTFSEKEPTDDVY